MSPLSFQCSLRLVLYLVLVPLDFPRLLPFLFPSCLYLLASCCSLPLYFHHLLFLFSTPMIFFSSLSFHRYSSIYLSVFPTSCFSSSSLHFANLLFSFLSFFKYSLLIFLQVLPCLLQFITSSFSLFFICLNNLSSSLPSLLPQLQLSPFSRPSFQAFTEDDLPDFHTFPIFPSPPLPSHDPNSSLTSTPPFFNILFISQSKASFF